MGIGTKDNGRKTTSMEKVILTLSLGVMNYASGEKYDGQWKDDKKQGRGVYTYLNGDRYEGGWLEDEKCWDGKSSIKF
jgi:hypothetical protein